MQRKFQSFQLSPFASLLFFALFFSYTPLCGADRDMHYSSLFNRVTSAVVASFITGKETVIDPVVRKFRKFSSPELWEKMFSKENASHPEYLKVRELWSIRERMCAGKTFNNFYCDHTQQEMESIFARDHCLQLYLKELVFDCNRTKRALEDAQTHHKEEEARSLAMVLETKIAKIKTHLRELELQNEHSFLLFEGLIEGLECGCVSNLGALHEKRCIIDKSADSDSGDGE